MFRLPERVTACRECSRPLGKEGGRILADVYQNRLGLIPGSVEEFFPHLSQTPPGAQALLSANLKWVSTV